MHVLSRENVDAKSTAVLIEVLIGHPEIDQDQAEADFDARHCRQSAGTLV